ncbi:MAG TPA: hypothetical protein VKN36_12840 [Eudoraea sp.]|nr:hypothetical protein [Eudoraea sp.]
MKAVFHKIVSSALAILLLASTTYWTVEKHYCLGHLVDLAFFSEADTCGMPTEDKTSQTEMECCTDERIVIAGQDDLKMSFDELRLDQQIFITSFINSNKDLFEGLREQIVPHNDYPPPLRVRDLQLLDQVFLI